MIKKLSGFGLIFFISSCSYITGPDGLFPPTKDEFLKEKIEQDIDLPNDLDLSYVENYYPVNQFNSTLTNQDVPKPRQIFSTSGDSSVQLRRLGELMWIYVETLPSTSWPISKSFWETSSYPVLESNPTSGEIIIDYDDMIGHPKKEIDRIYQFLNIPHYNHDYTEIGQFNINGVRYDDSYLGRDLHTIRSDGLSKKHYHVDIPNHLIDKCKELNIWKVN